MTFVGIDPGVSGAMAVLWNGKEPDIVPFDVVDYADMFDEMLLCSESSGRDIRCVVERVHAMPKQGVSSSFSFGKNFGTILGMLAAYKIPYELVLPQKWKREFGVTADKNTSLSVARRLFPSASMRRTERCRKDDDGMAEALLMAEYCRRHS